MPNAAASKTIAAATVASPKFTRDLDLGTSSARVGMAASTSPVWETCFALVISAATLVTPCSANEIGPDASPLLSPTRWSRSS